MDSDRGMVNDDNTKIYNGNDSSSNLQLGRCMVMMFSQMCKL